MHQVIIEAGGSAGSPWGRWLDSAPGRYVQAWERARFDEAVGDVFGFHAIQLGLGQLDALANSRIRDRIVAFGPEEFRTGSPQDAQRRWCGVAQSADPSTVAEDAASASGRCALVIERFEDLPFGDQTVDLVVLPHLLEFSGAPHQVLREVNRVLRPEGRIIVSGFNPISLWGARELLASVMSQPFLPDRGQLIGLPRLRDWFELLSFEIDQCSYGCYRPACRTELWLERTRFMERAGDRWWPICGAVYVVSAVKRVQGMRLMGPAWKQGRGRRRQVAVASPQFTPPPRRQRGPYM